MEDDPEQARRDVLARYGAPRRSQVDAERMSALVATMSTIATE